MRSPFTTLTTPYPTPRAPRTPLISLTHPYIFSLTRALCLHPAALRCTGKTFLGEAGAKLGKELLAAKRAGFPILMLHENDPAKHGCEFSVFFDGRTPTDLMQQGIYSALALALYPGEFQATSVACAALALGAMEGSPWVRLKAWIIDKCSTRKGGIDAQQDQTVLSGQKAPEAGSRRRRLSYHRKSAAAESTTSEISALELSSSELSTNLEMVVATRRTWRGQAQQAQLSTPPDALARSPSTLVDLEERAMLIEGKVHWRAESAFYKSTKVQLLSAPRHAGASDADAGAPPWSILVVNGKTIQYEEVTAVKVNEKILEFMVEHTRKYTARSERLHRQHLRMATRSEFRQWQDALRPEMINSGGGGVASTSAGITPGGESGASASAGYQPGVKRAASTSTTPANSVSCRLTTRALGSVIRRTQSENAKETLAEREESASLPPASPEGPPSLVNTPQNAMDEPAAQVLSSALAADGIASSLLCPITEQLMTDPVFTMDGQTYERCAIEAWLKTNDTSPVTGKRLPSKKLVDNVRARGMVRTAAEAQVVAAQAAAAQAAAAQADDEDPDAEAERRVAWIQYYLGLGDYTEATELGWDGAP